MKEQLPSPDFNSQAYERPNQKWVCGWLKDGKPCHNGPDGGGHCGASDECRPSATTHDDGTVTYSCTRPKSRGGPCDEGPRPDGRCAHPGLRCQPQLSLRAKRGILTRSVIVATFALLLVILYGSFRWKFISPGELSTPHSSLAFQQMAAARHPGNGAECAACHAAGKSGPAGWLQSASVADPSLFEFKKLLDNPEPKTTGIDLACQQCHPHHTFHEPNVAWEYSCSACHKEHVGAPDLKAVSSSHCVRCHGDEAVMQASAKKGQALSAASFEFQHDWTRDSFKLARPKEGFTKVITEFAKDHPEFLIHRESNKDPNTLRFSHATHRADHPGMTLVNGRPLDCASCHQPGADGVYYEKITFEQHCQSCHSLQFDRDHPGLTLPHGDPAHVRAFLGSLPQQYADYAARERGITAQEEMKAFVQGRIESLRRQYGYGEELEQKIFHSDERTAPASTIGGLGIDGRSLFPGCAYCHEVKPTADLPLITRPEMPQRWLSRGRFDHSKHTDVSCHVCHQDASSSTTAADIMLPSIQVCISCHQPQGGARHDCLECHSYHNQPEHSLFKALKEGSSDIPVLFRR